MLATLALHFFFFSSGLEVEGMSESPAWYVEKQSTVANNNVSTHGVLILQIADQ